MRGLTAIFLTALLAHIAAPYANAQQTLGEPEAKDYQSERASKLSEGLILYKAEGSLYYYRITTDSTVYIRLRSGKAAGPITLPAFVIGAIHERIEQHALADTSRAERLGISYSDQQVLFRFVQRFDSLLLGGLFVLVLGLGVLSFWLGRRLLRERRRRTASETARYHLIEGREKERERIARELHDGPVQDLHAVHLRLVAASHHTNGTGIEEIDEGVMRVTKGLRAVSADLRPPALKRFGLAAALRSFADRFREQYPEIQVELDLENVEEILADRMRLPFFRIAQEAMNNAAQHASAERVVVCLTVDEDCVHLTVEDDGQGFEEPSDLDSLAEAGHFGLLGMVERAEAIGGRLEVDSAPGKSTRICIQAPGRALHPSPR